MSRDSAAYQAAIQHRIAVNARKGRKARWMTEDREKLVELMARFTPKDHFIGKMWGAYCQWGSLTEGQEAATWRALDKMTDRDEAYAKANKELADVSRWVGEPKARIPMVLKIISTNDFHGAYGFSRLHNCRDATGNSVVYIGTVEIGHKGDTVQLIATIKSHDVYRDVRQTKITRPSKVVLIQDAAAE